MKAVKWLFLLGVIGPLGWYFFIKEYDYQVSFKLKTTVGTVNQSLKAWNSSLENSLPMEQLQEGELIQTIKLNDTANSYLWNIKAINDSMVKVSVFAKDEQNRLKNRLLIPFSEPEVEQNCKKVAEDFSKALLNHLKEIRIQIKGIEESPGSYVVYVPLEGLQIEKAKGMMANFNFLSSFIADNGLEPNGPPFLQVIQWDREKDYIISHFCFPFKGELKEIETPLISIKKVTPKRGIKAIYNGNYITSDRAWYALERYAKKHDIAIELLPMEVFFNNPNMGGDELNWKTEVFLPLKEE